MLLDRAKVFGRPPAPNDGLISACGPVLRVLAAAGADDDGHMSVAIMRADREPFAAEDLLGGTSKEKARAAETYVSYSGRYVFRGDRVIHHVELSLFPNWSGVEQERLVEVTGKRLTLRTRPLLLGGVLQSARVVWERV
jgi:Lipocalin-like domain